MAGGDVTIADARPEHMEMLLRKVEPDGRGDRDGPARAAGQRADGRLRSADVATLPYPGVATDYSPLLVAMLTVADGVGILTENLFSGRFRYVEELRRMGADIRTEGHHAVVRGVPRLSGAPVRAPDIRAGVALVLAGLVAEGETVVSGAHHIDRGYEDLAGSRCARWGPTVTPPVSPPLPDRPGGAARAGPARTTGWRWRGCSRTSSGAARRRRPWRELAYRVRRALHGRADRRPGRGQVDADRRADHRRSRGGWPAAAGPEPVPQVGVLAVDPTSPFSGGAILGDRVRMSQHALDPTVFIRSMATRGHLGGLSLAVPDAVRLLGAAGIGVVIVETVGVGQMEVEIASAADTTVVVVTPGWGDSMQANKAGLLEVADVFVINKADRPGVREARRDLEQMLDLARPGAWRPEIVDTTATAGEGVAELWAAVARHRAHLDARASWSVRRPSGWPTSCAGCCSPARRRAGRRAGGGGGVHHRGQGARRRRARPLSGGRPPAGRMSRRGPVRYGAAMAETFVTVERRPDSVALIRLDRPKANALSGAVLGAAPRGGHRTARRPAGGGRALGRQADLRRRCRHRGAGAERCGRGGATSPPPSARWPPCPGPRSPRSTATPSGAGSSWRSPATSASAPRTRASACPRCCSASSPAVAAPSACRASSGRRGPRS